MDKQIEKFEFRVIDNNTGEEADIEEIAFTEDWAEGLIYCDMEGFAILEDGSLVLLDECGNCAYCPSGRFSIIPESAVLTRDELDEVLDTCKCAMIVTDDDGEKYVSLDDYDEYTDRLGKIARQRKAKIEYLEKLLDDRCDRCIEQVRKDTAEKIADWLDNEKGYCGLGFLVKREFCTEGKENE